MALLDMYRVKNTVTTQLIDTITDTSTTLKLLDASILPDAPNYVTIGTGNDAEVILYENIDLVNNFLINCTRGQAGTIAKTWGIGENVYHAWTSNTANNIMDNVNDIDVRLSTAESDIPNISTNLTNHISNISNPHAVTASQIGLGNIDTRLTTAESNILTIDTNLTNHTSNVSNPHIVTALQIGLGNVDNTSDIDKPISAATQSAIDNLNDTVDINTNSISELESKTIRASIITILQTDWVQGINEWTYTKTDSSITSNTRVQIDADFDGMQNIMSSIAIESIAGSFTLRTVDQPLGNITGMMFLQEVNS